MIGPAYACWESNIPIAAPIANEIAKLRPIVTSVGCSSTSFLIFKISDFISLLYTRDVSISSSQKGFTDFPSKA
jgi:hypothetical protein